MVNVSCVQMKPELGQPEVNLSKMEKFIGEIVTERPETDLIVFPELITTGYECTNEQFYELSEHVPGGESVRRMAALSKKHQVHIVYGLPEKDARISGLLYNSCVLLGPDGEVIGTYRKTHPFVPEKQWCRAGSELKVFDTAFGRVGLMICWDTIFPEVARAYALQGADLLIVVTNWDTPFADDWDLATKARALDNTLHLVAANRIGTEKTLNFFGHSKIIDPVGKEIEALDEEVEGVIHAALDLSRTEKLRQGSYTIFKDRKPEIYGDLTR